MYNFRVRSKLENVLKHIGLLMSIVGLLVACISIVFIGINIKAIENQNTIASNTERNVRFSTAIEQLGSGETAITQGAIYTLHRIAQEDENYAETVFTIFCAYIRDTTSTVAYQEKYVEKPAETIQAIVNLLTKGKNKEVYDSFIIDFTGAYLSGIDLINADLENAVLIEVNLTRTFLSAVNFNAIKVIFSDFSHCGFDRSTFINANIMDTDFSNCEITNSNFSGAKLNMVNFNNINTENVSFFNCQLMMSDFSNAKLSNANFIAANLSHTSFRNSYLENADMRGAYSIVTDDISKSDDIISLRINKQTDLSGILGGYSEENPPFIGTPIFGSFTEEEAKELLSKYTF